MGSVFQVDELASALTAQAQLAPDATRGKDPAGKTPQLPKKADQAISVAPSAPSTVAVSSTSEVSSASSASSYERFTLLDDSTVDYGYLAKTGGKGGDESAGGQFYITTAINYTNGPAHMGHAYEAATTDVIARFHRLLGQRTYFLTGSDEHGQKIAQTAADQGKQPIEICNLYVTGFQCLNQRIRISNDDYLRTTSDRHKITARAIWQKCADNGDVYLDQYTGWYNVREETFVTDNEAALTDYKDPTSGLPLKQVEEESYFFRMSKYKDALLQHIQEHPEFILPESHRNQIVARLNSDDLRDLSISRTTFSWGIAVPEGFDAKHVMYVWLDALSNYLTGVNGLSVEGQDTSLTHFWPADVHVIGKDILWFHTVIWPCLLMSAGLALPKTVFAHGFVNDKDGKKMSKSLGNVVDPHDMLDKFDVDTFRWYLCKEAPYGGELAFSEDSMRDMHNSDLCDTLGNLVHRATNLCEKFCGGVVPDVAAPATPPVDFARVVELYTDKMNNFELQSGASIAIAGFRDVNGFLQEQAPWALKGDEHAEARQIIVRGALEAIYALTHLLLPFIPRGGGKIFEKLNTEPVALSRLDVSCRNLQPGTKIKVGDVLYTKSLSDAEIQDAGAAAAMKKESHVEAQRRKKEEKAKLIEKSAKMSAGTTDGDANQSDFTKMDIRVGQIVKVWNHPSADKLFCEEIDVGEDKPRTIASGLRDHYKLEDMENRKVLVVCNLKPSKMVGFESQGMVLAAKSADGAKVELVDVPDDAKVGERVFVKGEEGEPYTSTQVKKKKTWELVASKLVTAQDGTATWDSKPIETSAGACRAPTLVGAPIS